MLSSRIDGPPEGSFIDTTRSAGDPRKNPRPGGTRPGDLLDVERRRRPSGGPLGTLQETALLVFLARPAGTRIVAADLLAIRGPRLGAGDRAGRRHCCLAWLVAASLEPARRGHRGAHGRGFLARHARPEDLLDRHLLEVIDHLLEDLEGFLLVLRERVALAITAQPDAFLEMIHVQQVLA